MTHSLKKMLFAGLMASVGFAAMAQGMHGAGHGMMDPGARHAKMAAKHTQHLAELKAALKITGGQEAAWATFTTAMTPPVGMHRTPEQRAALKAELDKLDTPARIDKMRALHAERQAAMNANMELRANAAKTLYSVLTAEQKAVFDAAHKKMMDHMGGKHRGGHHG